MRIKKFIVGPIETNCYLVAEGTTCQAMVIDPDLRGPKELERVRKELMRSELALKYIVNTHGHTDHIAGNAELKRTTGAAILIHEQDASLLIEPWKPMVEMDEKGASPPCPVCKDGRLRIKVQDGREKAAVVCQDCGFCWFEMNASPAAGRILRDGDTIQLGHLVFRVIHTPGHTPGGISLYIKEENAVFTGDTLFNGAIGRTDLPGGSSDDIMGSLAKLTALPADTIVYPGHGEATTIAQEIRENPCLQKPAK